MAKSGSVGLEHRLVAVFDLLDQKYKFGEHYLLSFHTDNYGGEAFYDGPLESSEDAGGYVIRMSRGSMITIPKEALKDAENGNFLATWGDKIHKTLRSPSGKR